MPARAARRGGASAEDDAQAARRWILQNYDESEEEQDDVSEGELDAGIEDWLVCGDARERERRAAHRRAAVASAAGVLLEPGRRGRFRTSRSQPRPRVELALEVACHLRRARALERVLAQPEDVRQLRRQRLNRGI